MFYAVYDLRDNIVMVDDAKAVAKKLNLTVNSLHNIVCQCRKSERRCTRQGYRIYCYKEVE